MSSVKSVKNGGFLRFLLLTKKLRGFLCVFPGRGAGLVAMRCQAGIKLK